MRRFGWILWLMLALAWPAYAETVAEQVRAPERVQTEFASPSGGTVVFVDAPVIVPEAEAMYRIPVGPRIFGDEMVEGLAALFWPELQGPPKVEDVKEARYTYHWAGMMRWGTVKDDAHVDVSTNYYTMKGIEGPFWSQLHAELRLGNDKRLSREINYNAIQMDRLVEGAGIEGHPLTRKQAEDIALSFLRGLTDEPFEVFFTGLAPGVIYDDELILSNRNDRDTGYSYVVSLTRRIEGAPALSLNRAMALWERTDLTNAPPGYEEVIIALDLEGRVTHFIWSTPYELGEAREPQTLLPFEDILAIAGQTLPLMHTWEEIYAQDYGPHRITRIELGYMAVLQRDTMNFALTPVWCFYDTQAYRRSGDFWRERFGPDLTLSAVDGSVIDLLLGY